MQESCQAPGTFLRRTRTVRICYACLPSMHWLPVLMHVTIPCLLHGAAKCAVGSSGVQGGATPAEVVAIHRLKLCQQHPKRSACRGAEEVYAPLSGVETGDLTKRGGRYTPEFIWNVKWQDQVLALHPALPISSQSSAGTGHHNVYQSLLGFPALEGACEAWSNRAM